MTVAFIVLAGAFGLVVGSFLTVVVDRVPRGASIVAPGSTCGSCGLRLGPLDLIPVVSWLVLGGRCRRCRSSIGIEPLLLEGLTGLAFVSVAARFQRLPETAAYCVFIAGLVSLSWIDVKTKRLPREITYATAALGVPLLVLAALLRDEPRRIATMAGGAAIALTFMLAVYLASRGGLGDGDVRLAPLLGAFLGWLGLVYVPIGLFFGFLLGSVVGVAGLVSGRAGRKTALPFGPFLALGAFAAIFIGGDVARSLWGS